MIDEINKTVAIVWGVEDVTERAEEYHEATLSESEAWEILKSLYKYHDCNIGLSWDQIDCEIDLYLRQQREVK